MLNILYVKHCSRASLSIVPLFVAALVCLSLAAPPVFAQTDDNSAAQDNKVQLSEPAEDVPVENPYMNKIRLKALALAKNLNQQQLQTLQDIRAGFGMVRSVKLVQGDVTKAARLCRERVPELDEDMTARAESWTNAINDAVADSEKQIEELVSSDVFGDHHEDVMSYLELKDKAAKYADDQLQKSIVTDEETCRTLYESMAETKDELVAILDNIPWPDLQAEVSEQTDNTPETKDAPDDKTDDGQDK